MDRGRCQGTIFGSCYNTACCAKTHFCHFPTAGSSPLALKTEVFPSVGICGWSSTQPCSGGTVELRPFPHRTYSFSSALCRQRQPTFEKDCQQRLAGVRFS